MKIRITKISKSTLWYANLRKKTFNVITENEHDFKVENPNAKQAHGYYILKEDAEILKENNGNT